MVGLDLFSCVSVLIFVLVYTDFCYGGEGKLVLSV